MTRRRNPFSYVPGQLLYHGTRHDYPKPKLNAFGIFWTTPDPDVAAAYARPYYIRKDKFPVVYAWEVRLKTSAKVLDLTDLSKAPIRALFEAQNEVRRSGFGPWTEKDWQGNADFGVLEAFRWSSRFLAQRKVDAVLVRDNESDVPHDSVAILRLSAIASLERVVISE